jgi:hypothetical protein
VGGKAKNDRDVLRYRDKAPKAAIGKTLTVPLKKNIVIHNAREVNPKQIIPLDDDFKNF